MSDLTGEAERSRARKIALRDRLLTARLQMTANDQQQSSRLLQDQTLAWVRREAPEVIAAYVPVGAEPGSRALLDALAGSVGRVLLPVLLPDNDLDWGVYSGALSPGRFGLLEPAGERLGPAAIGSAAVILVPALAVDRAGHRMGRGGGSYDRALARLSRPSPVVLALLHDGELLDEVPSEPHDVRVHGAITPRDGVVMV